MKLFTGGIDKKLFAQFPKGSDLKNQKVIAKIFNPFGRGTWYIINSDPNDPDYLWAIVDLYETEVGSVSRKELESVRIKPFNLKLERDMYFDEVNAQELYDGLLEGKRYAKGGYMDKGGEGWSMSNGRVTLNGKLITYYDFDRDADAFFIQSVSGGGQKGFSTKEKVYEYLSENLNLSKYAKGGYMAKGGILEQRALKLFNKLEEEGKLKRYVDTRGNGKKYFETIIPNYAENGYWKRYESTSRSNIGTLQNEYLDKNDVINHIKKTLPNLEEDDKMAKGGYMANGGLIEIKDGGKSSQGDYQIRLTYNPKTKLSDLSITEESKNGLKVTSFKKIPYGVVEGFARKLQDFKDEFDNDLTENNWDFSSRYASADTDMMEYGANRSGNSYVIFIGDKTKSFYSDSLMDSIANAFIELHENLSDKYAKGGYMAKGGEVKVFNVGDKVIYAPNGKFFSGNRPNYKEGVISDIAISGATKLYTIKIENRFGVVTDLIQTSNIKELDKFAKGGYMANGGETEGVDLFEDYEDQPQEVTAILSKYELEDNDYDVLEELLAELKEIGYTFEYGLDGEPYDLRKIGQKGKSEFYAKGGYMAKGEDYEYVNTFKRFNSNVPVPQDDFKKLVDAYHKQLSGDKLDVAKYDVLKQQMGNYLGHETIEEMEEYIEKTHEAHKYAKGGSIKEKADYVSNRNIKSITLTMGGKTMTISGDSILDGVYVKKGTTPSAPRVQPKSVAAKISDLAFDSWEKFDINSGSEIYSSNEIQKKLNKDFKEKGIDEIFSKLDMAQRKKVADILTDNNDHSLRNYLALRGYLGKEERDMYVSLYEERKQRPVNLNPKNFPKVMAEGGRIGFEALSKKVAKRYEGKEVPTKYRSEYGSRYDKEEAKEVGDKVAAKVYRMQLGKK